MADLTMYKEPMNPIAPQAAPQTRFRIVNTWNGGAGGLVVVFTSKETGDAGHNECFEWIHKHTSFSFSEATTRQGYKVEPIA